MLVYIGHVLLSGRTQEARIVKLWRYEGTSFPIFLPRVDRFRALPARQERYPKVWEGVSVSPGQLS